MKTLHLTDDQINLLIDAVEATDNGNNYDQEFLDRMDSLGEMLKNKLNEDDPVECELTGPGFGL